jgi:hypothetical protein
MATFFRQKYEEFLHVQVHCASQNTHGKEESVLNTFCVDNAQGVYRAGLALACSAISHFIAEFGASKY